MQLAAIQLPDVIIDGPVDENGLSFSYDQDRRNEYIQSVVE